MLAYDYDFDRIDVGHVELCSFRWVCRRPFVDPMGLNDARAIARHQGEAIEYLLDRGAWRNRDKTRTRIDRDYDVIEGSGAPPFDGTWREWTQAVHHGLYPAELVRLPRGALTQEVLDARRPPVVLPSKPRKSLLRALEDFLELQSRYRRFWRGIGLFLALAGAGALVFAMWQAIVGLATTYVVIRAVIAGLRD